MNKANTPRLGILACVAGGLMAANCGGNSQPASPAGTGGVQVMGGTQDTGGSNSTGGVQTRVPRAECKLWAEPSPRAACKLRAERRPRVACSFGGAPSTAGTAGSSVATGTPDAAAGGVGGSRDADSPRAEVAAPAQCPAPPAGAPADAITALNAENAARVGMGIPCASLVLTLCTSAQNHCTYYTTNQGSATCEAASSHSEIAGCPQFTGADPGARIKAAGYTGMGWAECMAFMDDPAGAVKTFIDSVYHRTPVLSPWYRDMGYGGGTGCDTIDFGPGATTAKTVTANYPYDGQIDRAAFLQWSKRRPNPACTFHRLAEWLSYHPLWSGDYRQCSPNRGGWHDYAAGSHLARRGQFARLNGQSALHRGTAEREYHLPCDHRRNQFDGQRSLRLELHHRGRANQARRRRPSRLGRVDLLAVKALRRAECMEQGVHP